MDAAHRPVQLPGLPPVPDALARELWSALEAKGPDYQPRTHHLGEDETPRFINRLIFETSPYLLQHAHNPVDWHPWSEETFEKAKQLDRPIFLSVGYSTCHWCHVMERESFEDEEIAAFLNQHYVCIKVDREERPDVDGVYMTVVQLMTGSGGWPMSVVMLPDGRPYFGGTYFPARAGDRGAQVGFLELMQRLHQAYLDQQDKVLDMAQQVSTALQRAAARHLPDELPRVDALVKGAQWIAKRFDPLYGGVGRAPKFPTPPRWELLLRYGRRAEDNMAHFMVVHTLRSMLRGGIYDQVGGGFARYSTDNQWLVPHFEKMLYDNAQLLRLMVEGAQAFDVREFEETARDVADYVLREMRHPDGGFYSATDADSEGEEGRFFVWTEDEMKEVLSEEEAAIVLPFYGVSSAGNFEGRNILHRKQSMEEFAAASGQSVETVRAALSSARRKLYARRAERVPPLLDDKVLTEWNAQMIAALAVAGFAFDQPRYLNAAVEAAQFIHQNLTADGRLLRAFRVGEARHPAVLEDYTFWIDALIALFETTGERRWLEQALAAQDVLQKHFWDPEGGGYFGTADDAEALLVRDKPFYDGAQPAGNSVAALNLLRLHQFTERSEFLELAERTLLASGDALAQGAIDNPKMGQALDFYLDQPLQIVVAKGSDDDGALIDVLRKTFVPNRVVVWTNGGGISDLVPLAEGKVARDGKTTVYVCKERVCDQPTSDPAQVSQLLNQFVAIDAEPLTPTR
jgi:hypothetical protein